MTRKLIHLIVAVIVVAATTSAAQASATPKDATKAILAAFDKYQVVGVASPNTIFLDLIRTPAFPDKVNDIAVECGNSLYQPLLDRYIAGGDVPLSEVRQVNKKLPPARKVRVLACDPPIDWSRVTTPEDLAPFEERDRHVASVMKNEVLAKNRKALMLFGISHLLHGGGSAVAMYEREYPNVTYTIATHYGFQKENDKLEKRMSAWPVPSVVPFAGSWLGELDSSHFEPRPGQPPADKGYPGADAYLYTGPRSLMLRQPIAAGTVLDTEYIAELRRRAAAIQDPPDGLMRPETFFKRELESSVLEFGA